MSPATISTAYLTDEPAAASKGKRPSGLCLLDGGVDLLLTNYYYVHSDGIGDRAKRPKKLDLAWKSIETNQVGIDEFQEWAKRADTEPRKGQSSTCARLNASIHFFTSSGFVTSQT